MPPRKLCVKLLKPSRVAPHGPGSVAPPERSRALYKRQLLQNDLMLIRRIQKLLKPLVPDRRGLVLRYPPGTSDVGRILEIVDVDLQLMKHCT
jgi:hypothetical protein